MDKEKLESMLIEYIDGKLNVTDAKIIEGELEQNKEALILYNQLKNVLEGMEQVHQFVPSEALKNSFDQFLNREIAQNPQTKTVVLFPMAYRIAATVAIIAVTCVTAYWIHKDQQYQEQVAVLTKAVEESKRVMMTLISNSQSASQRIQGVSVAYEMSTPDDEIVDVLISTMNTDPNTNVRLAALDALGKFQAEPNVRKALIQSLSTQKDPVIQIALIQLMVTMKEKGIVKQLERMTKDNKTMKAVKDEAYSGIMKLS
jgi:hypothetical protein